MKEVVHVCEGDKGMCKRKGKDTRERDETGFENGEKGPEEEREREGDGVDGGEDGGEGEVKTSEK